jgi:uncharacterized protein
MEVSNPKEILKQRSHRPFDLPEEPWIMYQDWDNVIFLHWRIDKDALEPLLPKGVYLDLFEGEAWLSLVIFRVQHAHPRLIPPIPGIADFNEINLRTYVTDGSIPGITFFDIKANNCLQVFLNRMVGLPYKKAAIRREVNVVDKYITGHREEYFVDIEYIKGAPLKEKSNIDKWLTERYCSYQQINNKLFRYPIHHMEWPLKKVNLTKASVDYHYKKIQLSVKDIAIIHYSEGVSVLFWLMKKVNK